MNGERKICYYCDEEKPAAAIFIYKDKDGIERNICSDCQNAGKHGGT